MSRLYKKGRGKKKGPELLRFLAYLQSIELCTIVVLVKVIGILSMREFQNDGILVERIVPGRNGENSLKDGTRHI